MLFFPKGQVSYSLPGMPAAVELLRLRLAYGESGNQPRYGQKFTPLTIQTNLGGVPAQRLRGVLGNPNIRPERQREFDFGIDAITFDSRVVLELSVYQKTISDLLLERQVADSTGFLTEFINGGALRNRGVEAMLQVSPVRTGSFEWLTRTIFSLNRSKILDLPGCPPSRPGASAPAWGRSASRRTSRPPRSSAPRGCWPTASAARSGSWATASPTSA